MSGEYRCTCYTFNSSYELFATPVICLSWCEYFASRQPQDPGTLDSRVQSDFPGWSESRALSQIIPSKPLVKFRRIVQPNRSWVCVCGHSVRGKQRARKSLGCTARVPLGTCCSATIGSLACQSELTTPPNRSHWLRAEKAALSWTPFVISLVSCQLWGVMFWSHSWGGSIARL